MDGDGQRRGKANGDVYLEASGYHHPVDEIMQSVTDQVHGHDRVWAVALCGILFLAMMVGPEKLFQGEEHDE